MLGDTVSSSTPSSARLRWAPLLLCLLSLSSLLPSVHARFPIEKWECGNEDLSKSMSHAEVMKKCPHFASELNHCCVMHDDCYSRQKGQKKCDDEFDQCHKVVLQDERAGPCKEYTVMAYEIVDFFGSMSYNDSPGYVEPPESELSLCRPENTMGVYFDFLYLSCPTIKKATSSCCEQLSRCPDLPLGRNRTDCASRAMKCLSAARAEEDKAHPAYRGGHCDRAIERTRQYLSHDYVADELRADRERKQTANELFVHSTQAFLFLMVLSACCAFGLLAITYKYYRLRTENNERKYSTITLSAP